MADDPTLRTGHSLRSSTSVVGRGCSREVADLLDRVGAGRLLVVRDRAAWQALDGGARFDAMLDGRLAGAHDVTAVQPTSAAIDQVAKQIVAAAADAVLVIGGGTALDIAKAASVTAAAGRDSIVDLLPEPDLDALAGVAGRVSLIAMPTTAGTGAAATSTAVVYVDGVKHSLEGCAVRPDFALVDAALCDRLPAAITATTGLDCLCQAAESLWAVGSDDRSRAAALRALRLAVAYLERAVSAGDPEARDAMSLAAHLAGRAIDTSRTTAPHALSYVLSARHGVAHGHAVALFFGEVLVMLGGMAERDCRDARGYRFVRTRVGEVVEAFGVADVDDTRRRFEGLLAACGLATRLADVGVTADDVAVLADGVNERRLANHPQRLGPEAIRGLVRRLVLR